MMNVPLLLRKQDDKGVFAPVLARISSGKPLDIHGGDENRQGGTLLVNECPELDI